MIRNTHLNKVLVGETFRSVRKERRAREGSDERKNDFLATLQNHKSRSQDNIRSSPQLPTSHFKAAKFLDLHPKTIEEYGNENVKEFRHQNKLHDKRQVIK
mmetsp:Transcript_6131/g.5733  ORF Transcript_6131/g.5733 Transcript_6131/m.5733 type:complete len:101 (+) Transcript_6131:155-457(+)